MTNMEMFPIISLVFRMAAKYKLCPCMYIYAGIG